MTLVGFGELEYFICCRMGKLPSISHSGSPVGRVALAPSCGFSEGHRAEKESIRHPQAPMECWVSIPTVNGFPWTFYVWSVVVGAVMMTRQRLPNFRGDLNQQSWDDLHPKEFVWPV